LSPPITYITGKCNENTGRDENEIISGQKIHKSKKKDIFVKRWNFLYL